MNELSKVIFDHSNGFGYLREGYYRVWITVGNLIKLMAVDNLPIPFKHIAFFTEFDLDKIRILWALNTFYSPDDEILLSWDQTNQCFFI